MVRVTRKRLVVTALILLLLAGILVVTWEVCDWPPPRLILKYGLPPAGGPTGRKITVEGIEFIELSPGYYRRGSHEGCTCTMPLLLRILVLLGCSEPSGARSSPECPPIWIEIQSPFYISSTEVTKQTYARSIHMPGSDSQPMLNDLPVVGISWLDARRFTEWLSTRLHEKKARLPTASEWEYACRSGSNGAYFFGDSASRLSTYSVFGNAIGTTPASVASREPSCWGLYDMHGNVLEWCHDAWTEHTGSLPRDGSSFPSPDALTREVRGGAYDSPDTECRSACRSWRFADVRSPRVGFRPVISAK